MYSLFSGIHSEFISVAADVTKSLRNLNTLNEYIDHAYKTLKRNIERNGGDDEKRELAKVDAIYDSLKKESKRQISILSNLMNVSIGPTGESLIGLLVDNKDFTGLVSDLEAEIGNKRFSDKLSYLLTGISTVPHAASLVQKSLKKLDMSFKDYKKNKNLNSLRKTVFKSITKRKPTS